jgi:hypothetical protein
MAYPSGGRCLDLVAWLRRIVTTVWATATGVINVATRREESLVELKPGDHAPDFSLAASDGRTYGLKDLAGGVVVVAWFPKAFTGG